MRNLKLLVPCVVVAGLLATATATEAKPGRLGVYRGCGYTYAEAVKKCSNAFVTDAKGTYRMRIERLGSDGWIDASPAFSARAVIRQSDWNWIFYRIKYR